MALTADDIGSSQFHKIIADEAAAFDSPFSTLHRESELTHDRYFDHVKTAGEYASSIVLRNALLGEPDPTSLPRLARSSS